MTRMEKPSSPLNRFSISPIGLMRWSQCNVRTCPKMASQQLGCQWHKQRGQHTTPSPREHNKQLSSGAASECTVLSAATQRLLTTSKMSTSRSTDRGTSGAFLIDWRCGFTPMAGCTTEMENLSSSNRTSGCQHGIKDNTLPSRIGFLLPCKRSGHVHATKDTDWATAPPTASSRTTTTEMSGRTSLPSCPHQGATIDRRATAADDKAAILKCNALSQESKPFTRPSTPGATSGMGSPWCTPSKSPKKVCANDLGLGGCIPCFRAHKSWLSFADYKHKTQ